MGLQPVMPAMVADPCLTLQVYLLGQVEFDAALALQRLLVYQVAGDRDRAALVLCEHPPLITVGRHGSRAHILCEQDELDARGCPVRWVNRGGGCLLHAPGQVAVYPILALDRHGLGLHAYLNRLHQVLADVLDDFQIRGGTHPDLSGLWVGQRPIASVGVAVAGWVTYYGAALNINPDLEPYRIVRSGAPGDGPMTSLERERRAPLRPSLVRERLIEHFAARFGFIRTALFFSHPSLVRRTAPGPVATRS